jgi:methyl-accepting chemotaxis protein
MAEDLKTSTDSDKSSEAMAATSEELSATIEQSNSAAQQIMSAIRQIAKGAEQQGSATQESSSALSQIEKNVIDVGQKARISLEKVDLVQKILGENKAKVDELISGISNAAGASKSSAKNINALEVRVRQIDKIVDAIANTSMKTDMLAVNGGIEAARAGEFGKGFAVVASDIRSLATESAVNAEKIKDMVRNINGQITIVAKDVLEVGISSEREAQSAKKSTENLNIIETDMKEVQKGVTDIQKNAQEAVTGVSQAKKGVEQISAAAQQSSSAAQQASSSAAQQAKGMQELAKAVEEISAMADELQNK